MADNNKKVHSRYADGTPVYRRDRPKQLPSRDGNYPIPDPQAGNNPHTRLRWDNVNKRVYQGRTFGDNGVPIKDIDFTAEVNRRTEQLQRHIPVPHQQRWTEVVPDRPSAGYHRSDKHKLLSDD